MTLLKLIIAYTAFSVMFAYRNYWQIMQSREIIWHEFNEKRIVEAITKWHKWQFALQIFIGACIGFTAIELDQSWLNALGHGLLFGSVFWLIFDTLLGYLLTGSVLHVDSNGIGTIYTKIFKRYSGIALLISKVLLFIISILLTIL